MKNISGIYQIQSKIKPERIYIGSAVNINHRWECHISDLQLNKHHSKKLQRHFNKYGKDDLVFSVLVTCEKEQLIQFEQYYLDFYHPYFNVCKIAGLGCQLGLKRSVEFCERQKKLMKGKHISPKTEFKKGLISWNKGIKIPANKKINSGRKPGSIPWNKGKKASPEALYNLHISHLGPRPWRVGVSLEKLKKPILQYDKQGNFIKEWSSATDAINELNLHSTGRICDVLKHKYGCRTAYGFVWEYKNKTV